MPGVCKMTGRSLLLSVFLCLCLAGCGRDENAAPAPEAPPSSGGGTSERPAVVKLGESSEPYVPEIGRPGGTLVMSVISSPKSFNPILAKETSTTVVTARILAGLTTIDGITQEVKPDLAESWEIAEDGLSYTFTLREGLRWSDGAPLTTDDVKFTFDLIYDPDIPNSAADVFSIDGEHFKVEALDDRHVKISLPARFAPFLRGMGQSILPRHALEDAWKKGDFNHTWGVNTPPEEIVCNGPYLLNSYRPAERVVLKRNPYYWRRDAAGKPLPYIDQVILVIVKNQDVSLLKFQAGEIDIYGMRGSDFQILRPLVYERDFTIYDAGSSTGSSFVVFNQNPGKTEKGKAFVQPHKLRWFRNVNFRRAVSHAIDRKAIIDTLMYGWGYPQYGPMSVSEGFFYNPETPKYTYDPTRAKTLLAQEGFVDRDGDGRIEDRDGKTVEFNLFTNAENTVRIKIGNNIRKDFENVGIKVNFVPLEFNVLVTKLSAPPYDWDAILLGLTGGPEPHFGQNVWKSSGQLHEWYPLQESPDTPEEAEIDRIFTEGVQELDPDKRKALYDRWQVIAAEQQWMIYTVSPAALTAVRNKFGNLRPTPLGGTLHNLDEIFIKNP